MPYFVNYNPQSNFYYAIKHSFDFVLLLSGSGQYAPHQFEELVGILRKTNSQAVVGSRFLNKNRAK